MAAILRGPGIGLRTWSMSRDSIGHREYKVTSQVEVTSAADGPATVAQCPGLPRVFTLWRIGNDIDIWAWCRPDMDIKPASGISEGEPIQFYHVTQTFSTKPTERNNPEANKDQQDPLAEPQKVSGSFAKRQEEAFVDRFGSQIVNSAFEQIRGPLVEFERNSPTIKIEQNWPTLDLDVIATMVDRVNDRPLWGLPRRCWRLTNFSWERLFHGQSYVYYKRSFEFESRYETWDRDVMDEGTKVLSGQWDKPTGTYITTKVGGVDPNPNNPQHFKRATDPDGNPMKLVLNGAGLPAGVYVGGAYFAIKSNKLTIAFGLEIPGAATSPAPVDPGYGYVVGDLISLAGGGPTGAVDSNRTVLKVTAVGNQVNPHTPGADPTKLGNITAVVIQSPGSYITAPASPVAQLGISNPGGTGAVGTGATFTVTYKQSSGFNTSAGSPRTELRLLQAQL